MSQLQTILDLARGEIGVTEAPPESNCVKYNTAYYGREVSGGSYPWCCVFLWWIFDRAGLSRLFYGGGRTASCGTLETFSKKERQFVTVGYRPGDLVFFRFSGAAVQHIGLVEQVNADGTLTTIEGNTAVGNEVSGGRVMRRIRPVRYAAGACRPAYEKGEDMTQEQFDAMMDAWLRSRAAGEPSDFSEEARTWAESTGIILGDTGGNLQYQSFCTREQMTVFLYRLFKRMGQ